EGLWVGTRAGCLGARQFTRRPGGRRRAVGPADNPDQLATNLPLALASSSRGDGAHWAPVAPVAGLAPEHANLPHFAGAGSSRPVDAAAAPPFDDLRRQFLGEATRIANRAPCRAHATLLIEPGAPRLLIDPFFPATPACPVKADDARADFLLISHGHGDHLGDAVAIAKRTGATPIANYEIAIWLQNQGL